MQKRYLFVQTFWVMAISYLLSSIVPAHASSWIYYDSDGFTLKADATQTEIDETAVMRSSDDTGFIQYALTIKHDFSNAKGDGYFPNIGNTFPPQGKNWIDEKTSVNSYVDGIVNDTFKYNSRFVVTGYTVKGAPNDLTNTNNKANALEFDGEDTYVETPSISINKPESMSFEFMAKRGRINTKEVILKHGNLEIGFDENNQAYFNLTDTNDNERNLLTSKQTYYGWHSWKFVYTRFTEDEFNTHAKGFHLSIYRDKILLQSLMVSPTCESYTTISTDKATEKGCYLISDDKTVSIGDTDWEDCNEEWDSDWETYVSRKKSKFPLQICADFDNEHGSRCDGCYMRGRWTTDLEECNREWWNKGLYSVIDMYGREVTKYNSFSAADMILEKNISIERVKKNYRGKSNQYQSEEPLTFGGSEQGNNNYFKGLLKDIVVKINRHTIGHWHLDDGNASATAKDYAANLDATLRNFDTSSCWYYDQNLTRKYEYSELRDRQTVPEFIMNSPAEIEYDWDCQYAVVTNTLPDGFEDHVSIWVVTNDGNYLSYTGTGQTWYNKNISLIIQAEDDENSKMKGYRNNNIDPSRTITAYYIDVEMDSPQSISFIYSSYVFDENVVLGLPVMLSTVPTDLRKKINLYNKPEFITESSQEAEMVYWNDVEKKMYPVRGDNTFDLKFQFTDASSLSTDSVIVKVTTLWPETPHIIHIANTPPVDLDPSIDDEIAFISLNHVENDAEVNGNQFTATESGRSVLHFKRNYINDLESIPPTDICLSFNGKGFLETDPVVFSENFTIEFFAKRNNRNDVNIAIGHGDKEVSRGLSIGFTDNDHFMFSIAGGGSIETSLSYTDTNWHHWACVYETLIQNITDQYQCSFNFSLKKGLQGQCNWDLEECFTIGTSGAFEIVKDTVEDIIGGKFIWDPNSIVTRVCATADYNLYIYCDGKLVMSGSSNQPYNGQGNIRIGANNAGGGMFEGYLDEIRIWNTARTQEQIAENYNRHLTGNETDMMTYFRMDEFGFSYLEDNRVNPSRPINATFKNMDPSNVWKINNQNKLALKPEQIADYGYSYIRVVQTKLESEDKISSSSIVGYEISGHGYHDANVPHNGYVFFDKVPYNASIYSRETLQGPIYPVNIQHPGAGDDSRDNILIVWYKTQDGISWPYKPVEYKSVWPVGCDRIVISSMLGSEGKNDMGELQTYADYNNNQQNYFDPKRYEDIQIYNQPNPDLAGYNPNEEHAIVTGSYRNVSMSPQPSAAYALRNDLNINRNYALSFDGTDDYVDLGNSRDLKPENALTLECWVFIDDWSSINGNQTIVGNTQSSGYQLVIKSNKLQALIHVNGNYEVLVYNDSTQLSSGWHHVALTFDGQYISFYVDGEEKDNRDLQGNYEIKYFDPTHTLIGAETSYTGKADGWYFDGKIDELRIWCIARTRNQIKEHMYHSLSSKNQNVLLACYTFNQTSGTTLNDTSGNNRDGTLINMDNNDWETSCAFTQCVSKIQLSSSIRYTSEPFVLVQLFDKKENNYKMIPYFVIKEDNTCNYSFHHYMKAGDPVVPPFPLNEVIGATPPAEIFGFNKSEHKNCYWKDHKGQAWAISGSGDPLEIESATQIDEDLDLQETRYLIILKSNEFLSSNDLYSIKVTDNRGIIGYAKFSPGISNEIMDYWAVCIKGESISNNAKSFTVYLRPGADDLDKTNFKLFRYDEDIQISSHFWYPLQPSFWLGDDTPGDGTGNVGQSVAWLPDGTINSSDGFPDTMTGKEKAVEVTYNVVWPDDVPVLKAGETLTFPGGEYRADHSDYPGLPGVLAWATGQVVYDALNPTMKNDQMFTHYLVRLAPVLTEHDVDINITKDLEPSTKRVDVIMNRWYFKELDAGLKSRVYYDPTYKTLGIRGFLNDKTLGDDTLTAAPPSIYVLQPNILTDREIAIIKKIEGADNEFKNKVDDLCKKSKDPNSIRGGDYAVGLTSYKKTVTPMIEMHAKQEQYIKDMFYAWLGSEIDDNRIIPQISFGPGLAVIPNGDLLDPDNNMFNAFTEGYITLAENNHPDMGALPVSLHIIKVVKEKYRGSIKTVYSDNVFDEKITLRHSADFGANPDELVFEWRYREDDGKVHKTPNNDNEGWKIFPDTDAPPGNIPGQGMSEIRLAGAGAALLVDNLFYVRYRHINSNADSLLSWSNWAGAANSYPPDNYQPQLAEGWVKRVLNSVNPFEARVKSFYNSDNPATYVSMIQQAGPRYEGQVAFNPDKDIIENVGLIELYQTVLERAKALSIDLEQPVCTSGVVSALLLAASRISGFYSLLGNEAYNDALDPTIGFGTDSVEYGSLAPTIFTFMNQLPDLIDEEYALLCGRGENGARPVYNRLLWNFTKGNGEVAYALSYNINDVNMDGFIDEADARILYPQGHGDAWGHYLTAIKCYYDLLGHPNFNWESRSEHFSVEGVVIDVDYLDERKFAEAAAAKAKIGNEIVNITYRKEYVGDPDGQWQGYQDTNEERSWGVTGWAERTFLASYFDWAMANYILPEKDTENTGIKKVDRSTVPEILDIASQARNIQVQFDNVNQGLNPLGLSSDTVSFDINPYRMDPDNGNSATHFEQSYERAIDALENTRAIFDYANKIKTQIRKVAVSEQEFAEEALYKDMDYQNQLIENFGTPYEGTIGAGKVYPAGYQGPDYYYYNYIDVNDVSNETVPDSSVKEKISFELSIYKFFRDFSPYWPPRLDTDTDFSDAVKIVFPISTKDYSFHAPESWGMRKSPGEIQLALTELIKAETDLQLALYDYSDILGNIMDSLDLLQARSDLTASELSIMTEFKSETEDINLSLNVLNRTINIIEMFADYSEDVAETVAEGFSRSIGTSNDVTAPARSAIISTGFFKSKILRGLATRLKLGVGNLESTKELNQIQMEIDLNMASYRYEIKQYLIEINGILAQEAPARLEIFKRQEHMRQVSEKYRGLLSKGLRILEERKVYNTRVAQKIQGKRYMDMAFRASLNQALSKYRNSFDLASRYVYLAAKAYDYDTNFSDMDPLSAHPFFTQIIRQRHLGQYENGRYVIGQGGLGEILYLLKTHFDGLIGQMGFNNPQTETGRFSLRHEKYKLTESEADKERWKKELTNSVFNLWDIPEFRQYCRPFTTDSSIPQPGIVIRFPSTIKFGKNFFGQDLSGGDHAYDPTNFTTKIRSVGVWFEGYDNSLMSETPRVYLIPVGMDIMRIPNSSSLETRQWLIVDQQLPLPFPIQQQNFSNPTWIPSLDSVNGSMINIRRFSSFRAYHDNGYFDENQMSYETRLIGRSVWNNNWLLIIPGGTLHYIPEQGIHYFKENVTDIKLFFQTYAFSGN